MKSVPRELQALNSRFRKRSPKFVFRKVVQQDFGFHGLVEATEEMLNFLAFLMTYQEKAIGDHQDEYRSTESYRKSRPI